MSRICNTLTSDNLPALFAPEECPLCAGHGYIVPVNIADDKKECPHCGGNGRVPYPGTFAQQQADFISEVIEPIQKLLKPLGQYVTFQFNPNTTDPFSFTIHTNWCSTSDSIGTYCKATLTAAVEETLAKVVASEAYADLRRQLDADVEAYRRQRAYDLGLPLL